ncbi:Glycerophosphocholine phosphodiesterase [Nowakowskiella sp. JEL0078]|nr:Glycerophosphocholine phosphodiesterase [Nowakowskiella sp. JEL0078]
MTLNNDSGNNPLDLPFIILTLGSTDNRIPSQSIPDSEFATLSVTSRNANPINFNSKYEINLPLIQPPEVLKFKSLESNVTDVVFNFELKLPTVTSQYNLFLGLTSFEPMWKEQNQHEYTGRIKIPFVDSSSKILAIITIECVTIMPFQHKKNTVEDKIIWSSEKTKIVGHRGLGKNRTFSDFPQLTIGENTLLAFKKGFDLGASYVEFGTLDETGYKIPLHKMSLASFLSIHPQVSPNISIPVNQLRRTKSLDLFINSPISYSRKKWNGPWKGNFTDTIQSKFLTLENAFQQCPQEIGFNVEVKYPCTEEAENDKLHIQGINAFVDCILKCVFDNHAERKIFFSSFHPELCWMLKLKQTRFPVLFLTSASSSTFDRRNSTIDESIKFATWSSLAGIVINILPLLENPSKLKEIRKTLSNTDSNEATVDGGMIFATWGSGNNIIENVLWQIKEGVDAIILDSIGYVVSEISKK